MRGTPLEVTAFVRTIAGRVDFEAELADPVRLSSPPPTVRPSDRPPEPTPAGPAYLDHAREAVRLALWYVWRLRRDGAIGDGGVEGALATRVNLYRRTTLYDGTRDVASGHRDATWSETSAHLARLVRAAQRAPRGPACSEVEAAGLELLAPILADAPREIRPGPWIGCWSGVAVGPGIADGDSGLRWLLNPRKHAARARRLMGRPTPSQDLELHFANACAPQSPFDDRAALSATLRQLLEHARRSHPDLRRVWCNTWLNSRPVFTSLFPEAWSLSARTRRPEGGRGFAPRGRGNTENWWGQFTDRTGGFHHGLAQRFRESGGVFPFPCRLCHAPIDAVLDHR